VKTIGLGVLVFAIAFSIYANQEDAFAHHVLQKIPVVGTPMNMELADDSLYVSSFEYPRISIIDIKNNKDTGFITTSSSGIMDIMPVPDKNKIYVAPFESGGIDVYALSTKLLIKTIPLPESEITIQTTSNQPYGHRSDMHFLTGGWSLDYNPTNELLYVADYNSNLIYVIDGKSDEVIETIPVPRHPFTVRADPITNTIIVASLAGNEISFLEQVPRTQHSAEPTHQIVETIQVSGAPWGLDIDPLWHLAYVTNRGCECITVINILEKEVVDTIPLGDRAQAIAVDTTEHQIFASYLTQNKIVKIDGNINEIVSSWDVGSKSWDLAVNPNTHKFYASLKATDEILILGPKSISISLPVVTLETPATFLDLIYFHGQDVKASDPFVNTQSNILLLNLQTEDGGKVAIQIPRNVLDAKQGDGDDARFDVRVDGNIVPYEEIKPDEKTRTVSIQIPRNAHAVTISGTISAQEMGESLQSKMITLEPEMTVMMQKDVICEGKVWIESTKGKIACVTPSTAQKLMERGWGTILE
jgi:YVTN family beta-propeller protein